MILWSFTYEQHLGLWLDTMLFDSIDLAPVWNTNLNAPWCTGRPVRPSARRQAPGVCVCICVHHLDRKWFGSSSHSNPSANWASGSSAYEGAGGQFSVVPGLLVAFSVVRGSLETISTSTGPDCCRESWDQEMSFLLTSWWRWFRGRAALPVGKQAAGGAGRSLMELGSHSRARTSRPVRGRPPRRGGAFRDNTIRTRVDDEEENWRDEGEHETPLCPTVSERICQPVH